MHALMTAQSNGTYYGVRVDDATVMHVSLYGTWDGATATIEVSDDKGVTWRTFVGGGVSAAYTSNNKILIEATGGERYRVTVASGGGTCSLTVKMGGRFVTPIASATA
jgi:hypothetical protein